MTYGESVMLKRKALGLTQKEFAEITGTSVRTIVTFEKGEKISEDLYLKIRTNFEKYTSTLDYGRYTIMQLVAQANSLLAQTDEENLKTLPYITKHSGTLGIYLTNKIAER